MMNRRDILRSGAALPALSLATLPFARAIAGAGVLTLERFVFDVRFAESGAIAEHDRAARRSACADRRRLMTLWYDELDLAWRKAPMALAGVTLAETLFVLETFALDRNMHVVYRGEHGLVENGKITHRLAGPARAHRAAVAIAARRGRTRWPRRLPNVRSARREIARAELVSERRRAVAARHAAVVVDHRAACRGRVQSRELRGSHGDLAARSQCRVVSIGDPRVPGRRSARDWVFTSDDDLTRTAITSRTSRISRTS